METSIVSTKVSQVIRQRNLFLTLVLGLALSNLLLALKLVTFDQRIILVPGLQQEMSVSNKQVSSSYLEQMAMVFLSALLDISPHDIQYKKALVLKSTSNSSRAYSKAINDYFAKAEEEYSHFNLATYFTVKNLQINQSDLQVVAHGILTSWFGKSGHEVKEVSYLMSFDYSGGVLRLKEFQQVEGQK